MIISRSRITAAAAAAAVTLAAGCGATAGAHARAGASSAVAKVRANPATRQDLTRLEGRFLGCLKATHGRHRIHKAVTCTWPKGNTAAIERFAIRTATPGTLLHPSSWVAGVAAYAIAHGQAG